MLPGLLTLYNYTELGNSLATTSHLTNVFGTSSDGITGMFIQVIGDIDRGLTC